MILNRKTSTTLGLCHSSATSSHSSFSFLSSKSFLGPWLIIFLSCACAVHIKFYYYLNIRNATQSGCGIYSLSQSNYKMHRMLLVTSSHWLFCVKLSHLSTVLRLERDKIASKAEWYNLHEVNGLIKYLHTIHLW